MARGDALAMKFRRGVYAQLDGFSLEGRAHSSLVLSLKKIFPGRFYQSW